MKKKSILELAGYGYGLGISVIALQMFVYSWLRIPWSVVTLLVPWLIYFVMTKKRLLPSFAVKVKKVHKVELMLVILIGLTCVYVLTQAVLRPVIGWDAFSTWLLAGKVYFLEGYISPGFSNFAQTDIPPLLSLMAGFYYYILGAVDDQSVLLLFSGFYIAFAIIFYFSLRAYMPRSYALFFTFLFISTQNLIRHGGRFDVGYADLPLGYFFFAASLMLVSLIRTHKPSTLLLMSIFAGFAAVTKVEGFMMLVLLSGIAAIYLFRKKKILHFYILTLGFVFVGFWELYSYIYGLFGSYITHSRLVLARLPQVSLTMAKEFFVVGRWNLIWPVFFLLSMYRTRNTYLTVCIFLVYAALFFYLVIYLITPYDPIAHVTGSFDRLLIHMYGPAMVVIAVNGYRILSNRKLPNGKK